MLKRIVLEPYNTQCRTSYARTRDDTQYNRSSMELRLPSPSPLKNKQTNPATNEGPTEPTRERGGGGGRSPPSTSPPYSIGSRCWSIFLPGVVAGAILLCFFLRLPKAVPMKSCGYEKLWLWPLSSRAVSVAVFQFFAVAILGFGEGRETCRIKRQERDRSGKERR